MMTRPKGLLLAGWLLLLASFSHAAMDYQEIAIAEPSDLSEVGREARQQGIPILLMFAADHCPYCHFVEDDFLEPMERSGDYQDKILIRKVDLDSHGTIRDFYGRPMERYEFAERYKIKVTPTLLFVDHQGVELVPKMVGVMTPDFYGGYIDDAIDEARLRLWQKPWGFDSSR